MLFLSAQIRASTRCPVARTSTRILDASLDLVEHLRPTMDALISPDDQHALLSSRPARPSYPPFGSELRGANFGGEISVTLLQIARVCVLRTACGTGFHGGKCMTTRPERPVTPCAPALRAAIGRRDWASATEILRDSSRVLVAEPFVVRGMTTAQPVDAIPTDADELAQWGRAPDVADRLSIGTVECTALRLAGRTRESADIAVRLEQIAMCALREQPDSVATMLPSLRLQWAISCQLAYRTAISSTIFRRSSYGAESLGLDVVVRSCAGSLALNYAFAGELGAARECLEKWDRTSPAAESFEQAIRVPALIARALIALEELDLASAAQAMAELGELHDNDELWVYALFAHSQYALLSGTAAQGLGCLDRSVPRYSRWQTPDSAAADTLLECATVDLHCALGQGDAALTTLRLDADKHPMLSIARARVALLSGDPTTTLRLCTHFTSHNTDVPRIQLEALVMEAAAYAQMDRARDAIASWRRATALADTTGMVRPFALLPQSCIDALADVGATFPKSWGRRRSMPPVLPDRVNVAKVTERERIVLAELANGLTRFEIAAKLQVSPHTVKAQINSLFRRLDAHTRDEAVRAATELKLL